jgi:hypothetical protein
MNVVVVGGHTRNIGKTSVMTALIREFAPLGWSAVKITQYGHGVCSHDGHECGCAPEEHPFALTEERDALGRSDTSRFLAAGAGRSLWLRVRQGQLGMAMPLLRRKLDGAPWVVIESNSIMEFIDPLLYLVVLNTSRADFKASADRWLRRAHALIAVASADDPAPPGRPNSTGAAHSARLEAVRSIPSFRVHAPDFWSPALTTFVRERLAGAPEPRAGADSEGIAGSGTSEEATRPGQPAIA